MFWVLFKQRNAIKVALNACMNHLKGQICKTFARDCRYKGSGALLVRFYKDAGAPAIECSLTKF